MKMSKKFGEAIGIWELELNGIKHTIRPKMGDNYRMSGIMTSAKKHGDQGQLFKDMGVFIKDIVLRDYPDATEEEKQELDLIIEFNIAYLMKELMIAFRWTTREKYDEIEKKELQKNE